jgi:hypothetical protein
MCSQLPRVLNYPMCSLSPWIWSHTVARDQYHSYSDHTVAHDHCNLQFKNFQDKVSKISAI